VLLLTYFLNGRYYFHVVHYVKDLKEGKKIRISEADVLKKAGQLFTLRLKNTICHVADWIKYLLI